MSYDRQIDQTCTHGVLQEALYFADDRQTVAPIRPIANALSVKVRLNGVIDVPSAGARISATLTGTRDAPFNIKTGANNVFRIQVGTGAVQTVVLPASHKMPLDQMVLLLNQGVAGVTFSAAGSRVKMTSADEGKGATVFLSAGSTLNQTIGFPLNRQVRGVNVAPGWTLISDPRTLADRPRRLIVFDEPVHGFNDYVEINYTTERNECRRCGGTGTENDWRYAVNGEVVQVVDEALLIQEIQKLFYTVLGSNQFHDWYGTNLLDTVGKKLTPNNFIQNLIVSDIYQAFRRWQSVKHQQETSAGQYVSDREYPFALTAVNLQQSTKDPTVVFVKVVVQNRSGDPIQLDRGLRLPTPLSLVDPTAAQGQIRQSLNDYVLTG
jgi:phage baseplate assembly protein W